MTVGRSGNIFTDPRETERLIGRVLAGKLNLPFHRHSISLRSLVASFSNCPIRKYLSKIIISSEWRIKTYLQITEYDMTRLLQGKDK